MRILLTAIVVAMLGWSGFWLLASNGVKSGVSGWFDARRADGWVAEYDDLSVRGYPNRIDTSLTGLILADPETGLAWEAPFFQLLALGYKPNHVIAVWPPEQVLSTPLEKLRITSDDMRASLVLDPDTDLSLRRSTLSAENMTIDAGSEQGRTGIAALTLAAERVAIEAAPAYRLGLRADGFAPSLPWRALLDPGGSLPDRFEALSADLTVTFDRPWDRFAIEDARPQPRRIDIRLAEARWGQLELQLAGQLEVDAEGLPEGAVMVKARNWREILQLGVQAGALPAGLAATLEDGLSLLAGLSGNPKTLDVPLEFRRGRVYLGPVPVGPAPVLRLR